MGATDHSLTNHATSDYDFLDYYGKKRNTNCVEGVLLELFDGLNMGGKYTNWSVRDNLKINGCENAISFNI